MPAIFAMAYHSFVGLKLAGQQLIFAHRLLGEFRVDTGRSKEEEFLNADLVAAVDTIKGHGEIVSEKIRRVGRIGQNSTHMASRHDDDIRLRRKQIMFSRVLTGQIKLAVVCHEHVAGFMLQPAHKGGASHTGTTRHEHTLAI